MLPTHEVTAMMCMKHSAVTHKELETLTKSYFL